MFNLIVGILILAVGLFVGFYLLKKSKAYGAKPGYKMAGIGTLAAAGVVCVVLIVSSMMISVPTGHTGVVTVFGRVENYTLDAGMHAKAPWSKVITMDNRVQKASVNLSCFSSDIQEVQTVYTLNYQINKNNAQEIYSTVGISYYDTVITPNVAEAVKTIMARYTAEELIGSRDKLASEIETLLTMQLLRYNIEVVSTAIEDMDFTDAFTNAVEEKQVAAQNKLKAEIEQQQKTIEQRATSERDVIKANAEAEVAKIQAEADLEVTKIQADAAEYAGQKEAAKNRAISEALTEELLQYYYVQQWNGVLPQTYLGSDNVSTIIGLGGDKTSSSATVPTQVPSSVPAEP